MTKMNDFQTKPTKPFYHDPIRDGFFYVHAYPYLLVFSAPDMGSIGVGASAGNITKFTAELILSTACWDSTTATAAAATALRNLQGCFLLLVFLAFQMLLVCLYVQYLQRETIISSTIKSIQSTILILWETASLQYFWDFCMNTWLWLGHSKINSPLKCKVNQHA